MIYQVAMATIIFLIFINLILNLNSLKVPLPSAKIPGKLPLISVLVPARNEQVNIARCLDSLLKQDYPNYEILVLDDNSSDNTAPIVEHYENNFRHVRLINGEQPEKGWSGKSYACWQLAREASGDWLLFTDADTVHEKHMLRSTLALAKENKLSLLSGIPRQLGSGPSEKIAVPLLYFIVATFIPFWFIQRQGGRRPSVAIGQFLMFNASFYHRIGGHKAVKNRIMEDVWLAYETTQNGGRYLLADLSGAVACNMYTNVVDMWDGFTKWMYSVASITKFGLGFLMVAGYMILFSPFYGLWNQLFVLPAKSSWFLLIVFQVVLLLLLRLIVDLRFKNSLLSAFLHPLGFIFLFSTCIYALSHHLTGTGIRWKERYYGGKTTIK